MTICIRVGTLDEVTTIVESIDEFVRQETVCSLEKRLAGKVALILVAEENEDLLGFKIGYQLDDDTFYSWFGGVSPLARNKGVAQSLLDFQEGWVIKKGYSQLKVKSRNQFPAMLRLLLRNNYMIEKYTKKQTLSESEIEFIKNLKN